jgi:hypothetical protein
MQSIKINTRTKEKIEKTQVELLLKRNQKLSQAEILEKIIETAISDPEFMEMLFPENPVAPTPRKKNIEVQVISRKKPSIRLFEEEWHD